MSQAATKFSMIMQVITLIVAKRELGMNARGFTLLETLIAFVILATGVVGIVSLILMAKGGQHQAIQRTRAVNLADAMVEKIRINPSAMATYNIGGSALGDNEIASQPSPDCSTATCNPAELATHDLWEWEQALMGEREQIDGDPVGGLMSPQGCITFTAVNGRTNSGEVRVDVQWRGLLDSSDAVQSGEFACGGAAPLGDRNRRKVVVQTLVVDARDLP